LLEVAANFIAVTRLFLFQEMRCLLLMKLFPAMSVVLVLAFVLLLSLVAFVLLVFLIWRLKMSDMELDISSVQFAAGPLAVAIGLALRPFAGWLARFFGSTVLMGIFAFVAELIPRFLGLGQGLISWGFGLLASASFSAFQSSMSLAGVEVPSFSELLSGLPPGILWAGSALRVDKVAFILVSIPIVKLLRRVFEHLAASVSKGTSVSLLRGGR
jgi:uncharacterized membrane protein YjfL (UPF0719 family)